MKWKKKRSVSWKRNALILQFALLVNIVSTTKPIIHIRRAIENSRKVRAPLIADLSFVCQWNYGSNNVHNKQHFMVIYRSESGAHCCSNYSFNWLLFFNKASLNGCACTCILHSDEINNTCFECVAFLLSFSFCMCVSISLCHSFYLVVCVQNVSKIFEMELWERARYILTKCCGHLLAYMYIWMNFTKN